MSNSTVSIALSVIGLGWYVVVWSVWLLACRTARARYRHRPPSARATSPNAPGVSILRPLKGLDPHLFNNLESTFVQEYPNFEVLLSVAEEDDPALAVARALVRKYPQVQAKIIIGEEDVGPNPKVNNLMKSYRQANHDILWVLDSNASVARGMLARAVDALEGSSTSHNLSKKRVALVHHVVLAAEYDGCLGARVEAAYLTSLAKIYLAVNAVAIEACVIGKSNLYRRSDLEKLNGSRKLRKETNLEEVVHGLSAFGSFMAEDNSIACSLWHELDARHDLSCDVVYNILGRMTMADFIQRRVRWIRVRKHVLLPLTLEPFAENLTTSCIAAASVYHLFGLPPWVFLPVHHVAWLWVDLDVYKSIAGHPLPAEGRWRFIGAWCIREVLAVPIWILGVFGNVITWRGERYQVMRAGQGRKADSGTGSTRHKGMD